MARSSYIYVLYRFDDPRVLGVFTVKHELEAYRKREGLTATTFAKRHKDGHPETAVTDVVLP